MKSTEKPRIITKTTICAPKELMDRAIERARSLDKNFSQYCRGLINQDLKAQSQTDQAQIQEPKTQN